MARATDDKVAWSGDVIAIQPRIRLTRSFDQFNHSYLGYVLRVRGVLDADEREFTVGIGKDAQRKHRFEVGAVASGIAVPVADPRMEPVEFYRCSGLNVVDRRPPADDPPPWHGIPVALEAYRERGHRRLAATAYARQCSSCTWGCQMAVEMIIDPWNPDRRKYRTETFCYGPKSCRLYAAGPKRVVPGRRGMSYVEEDWIDEEATRHRAEDD